MNSREYLIELRNSTGMSRKEFCEYFEIPYRTLQDWELGNRKMPEYLLRLMAYKIEVEKHSKGEKNYGDI
ncbi:MAG: transcriptional regulator [Lachnospiraceae bacterium]|nr:transcriptional regulator [Lachnospiraceae bacterium]